IMASAMAWVLFSAANGGDEPRRSPDALAVRAVKGRDQFIPGWHVPIAERFVRIQIFFCWSFFGFGHFFDFLFAVLGILREWQLLIFGFQIGRFLLDFGSQALLPLVVASSAAPALARSFLDVPLDFGFFRRGLVRELRFFHWGLPDFLGQRGGNNLL